DLNSKVWRCECGRPLDVILDVRATEFRGLGDVRAWDFTMWRYMKLLPIASSDNIVTLGEGWTPVMVRKLYGVELILKLDYLNPTGSFKDRGASCLISHLVEIGVDSIIEDSSGNAGAAIAAYASVAGIKCRVFVPASAPEGKKLQIRSYGAELVEVSGDLARVSEEALKESEKAYYASHMWNPFFIEGIKTIAYECVEQMQGSVPDVALAPVGSGGLLLGIYKGYKELVELGLIDSIPRMIAIQAQGYTPVYDYMYGSHGSSPPEVILADGIAVPRPPRLEQIVKAIKETKGDVVVIDNAEIIRAFKELAKLGFFVEPTSATALAALWKGLELRLIEKGESALLPLTGIGLKAIDKLTQISDVIFR
ncbi:MAG: threonine synthase, partial [Thermoprotei archaeon]